MAMLAATRRAPSVRPGHEAPLHAVSVSGQALAAHLRELGASAASPEDALEPMLQAIVTTTGAAAGALCLYDIAQQVLRLAAEIGLSDEGCRKLRLARRGDADSWDMPLHGMLNRRCYLIENAAQNRFVPPLIPDAEKTETVACLPVYSGETPLASLILVTRTPHTLGERELHGIEAPVYEVGRLIETMRQRALGHENKSATPASVPRIGPGASGGAATALPPGVPSADTARLAAELARVERERDRVTAELETLHRDLQGKTAAHAAELERLRAQLGEAETGAARERGAREQMEARLAEGAAAERQALQRGHEAAQAAERARAAAVVETARLRAELDRVEMTRASASGEADARIVQLRTENDQVRARLAEAEAGAAHERRAREELEARLTAGVSAGQDELRKAFEAAREAERARATALAEVAELRIELEHVRQSARASGVWARLLEEAETQLEAQLHTLREALREDHTAELDALNLRLETLAAEADRLRETEATISSERDRLAADLEGTAAARAHVEETLKGALEEARTHTEEATTQLRDARIQAWDVAARLVETETTLAASREEYGAEIAALTTQFGAARQEYTAEVASLTTQLGALREELASLDADLTAARDAHATEVATLSAKLATLSTEAEQLRAERTAVGAVRDQLTADLESTRAAQAEVEETLRQVLEESRDRAATPAQPQSPSEQSAGADASVETPPAASAPTSVPVPPARPAASVSPAKVLELEQRLVAVLGGDPTWGRVSLEKHEVVVLAPDADIVAQLEEMRPGRVVGNLAVPGVLRALVAVREARVPLRLWGCIADGTTGRVLPLGPIEPAARPLAPDMVVASLASRATNGARVVTVGADTDALLSLRQALTRQGMSVSMTWDEKQASDMVEMVRPGIVVVDLSMQREACAFVAQLSRTNPIPTVVLIESTSDTAMSFAAALGDRAHASQMTSLESYLAAMLKRR